MASRQEARGVDDKGDRELSRVTATGGCCECRACLASENMRISQSGLSFGGQQAVWAAANGGLATGLSQASISGRLAASQRLLKAALTA